MSKELDRGQITAALIAGSMAAGRTTMAATMLVFASGADLEAAFEKGWIEVTAKPDPGFEHGIHARVTDWSALAYSVRSASAEGMLKLAGSFAVGTPYDLRKYTEHLTASHARHVAGAVLVAAGVQEWMKVVLTDTAPEAMKMEDDVFGSGAGK